MLDATFTTPDLTTFTGLDTLGLQVTGQFLQPDRAVLACRVLDPDDWCHRCGCHGRPRDTVSRRLAHEPFGWRPTVLLITLRRYRCTECGHVWRQDTSLAAQPRAKISRAGLRWALAGLVTQHLSMARVAEGLGVAWNTANDAVLAEGHRVLISDPARFDGVAVIGVDDHVWRHTRRGDKYVTVVIDLTPVRDGTGPARLLDMVPGRSKQIFKDWLSAREPTWREGVEVVAIDGFTGFKTAATEEIPEATTVMDPFHVSDWAGTPSIGAADESSSNCTGTAAAPATRCTVPVALCTPERACSPTGKPNASQHCSRSRSMWKSSAPGASTNG